MRNHGELTKEERHQARNQKKRKIKAKQHGISMDVKDKLRQDGLPTAQRHGLVEAQRKVSKAKGKTKEGQDGAAVGGKRTNSSSKVFSNLQKIVADDYKRKDAKRELKSTGKQKSAIQKVGASDARKYLL